MAAHYALRLNYKICPVEGMGLGVVATQTIHRGECIMIDYPLLIRDGKFYDHISSRSDDAMKQENEEIAAAIAALPKERQRAFLELHCATPGKLPFLGTMRANTLSLNPGHDFQSDVAVFPELARLNHDCASNAEYSWDAQKQAGRVHAVKNIAAGQQITINYWTLRWGWQFRRSYMNDNFKFMCTCTMCGAGRNQRQVTLDCMRLIDELAEDLNDVYNLGRYPEESLLRASRREYTFQKMEICDSRQAYTYYYAWQICVSQGDNSRAQVFGDRAVSGFRDCFGEDNERTIAMRKKVDDSEQQLYWNLGDSGWHHSRLNTFKELTRHYNSYSKPEEYDAKKHEKWLWRPGKLQYMSNHMRMLSSIPLRWRDEKNETEDQAKLRKSWTDYWHKLAEGEEVEQPTEPLPINTGPSIDYGSSSDESDEEGPKKKTSKKDTLKTKTSKQLADSISKLEEDGSIYVISVQ